MTRFPLELDHFLDRNNRTAGQFAQARRPGSTSDDASRLKADTDGKQEKKQTPKAPIWKLKNIVSLIQNEPTPRDFILRASLPLGTEGVPQGKWLRTELAALKKRDTRCVVETFANTAAMTERAAALDAGKREAEEQQRVRGNTIAFRESGTFLIRRNKSDKPAGFHVLIKIPSPPSRFDMPRDEHEAVYLSGLFSWLSLTTTLFHELLHAWWITTKSSSADYVISGLGDDEIEQPLETGHGDATWEIPPRTLALSGAGSIRPAFEDHMTQYVKEVVRRYKLQEKAQKIRNAFKKSSQR